MSATEKLLEQEPFSLPQDQKSPLFMDAMKESFAHHIKGCDYFKTFVSQGSDPDSATTVEDLPFLPVTIFKELELITGNPDGLQKNVTSSSTSGKGSRIFLDSATINYQRKALAQIMQSFIGDRKVFIVLDAESTVKAKGAEVSSRAVAIRGMLPFAKKMHFVLDDDLKLDMDLLQKAVDAAEGEEVVFFGFTWLIYKSFLDNKESGAPELFSKVEGSTVLHIGGWKKLKDIMVEKKQFNQDVSSFFSVKPGQVMDFYGMTEQLGTVYPDCEHGFKHAPAYSEIIIRDVDTFKPCAVGESGFIQLVSPLPQSYPGISLLSDDIGTVVGVDDCPCGRKGRRFVFNKRAEKAEVKGCGDTLG